MEKNFHISSCRPSVVFVTAHPDDVAFYMGGTAALLKEKYDLHIICATRGERGRGEPSEELAKIRAAEEQAACDLLRASLIFLGLEDGNIHASRAAVLRVAEILKKIQPVALFTHGPLEKPDHAAVYLIAWQALHRAELFWEVETYMALQDGTTRQATYADIYVNISSVLEQKRALIACHQSHLQQPGMMEELMAHSALFGKLAICEHAEPFMTGLPLTNQRWNRKAGSVLLELGG